MKQVLQDNSISPCLVDDYRYLNKGIPNFFDYNILAYYRKHLRDISGMVEFDDEYQMDMLKFRP